MEAPLVWVDLEMTGLDPARDVILEVAVIVTDGELEHLEEGPDLVVSQPEAALAGMPDHVAQMHAKSGLTEEVRRSELSLADAEEAVLGFVRGCVAEERTAPLAGNSVHADRAFLEVGMPSLNEYLHYRLVDVSTVKELARRWHPQALDSAPQKAEGHRALADIQESIAELRHYRTALFRQA